MTTPTPESERHRIRVHELGHFLVGVHYGIHCEPKVFIGTGQELALTCDGQQVLGECELKQSCTPYQKAVMAWGGILAEHLLGVNNWEALFPLNQLNLKEWFNVALSQNMSAGDRLSIACYKPSRKPSPWLACKAAYRILRSKKATLARLARVKDAKPTPLPPPLPKLIVPESFPASEEDFIRLVCGGDGDRYLEFLLDRVRQRWGLTGAGADEAKAKIMEAIRQANPGKSDDSIVALFDEAFKQAVARERKEFVRDCARWPAEWSWGVAQYEFWLANKSKQEAS